MSDPKERSRFLNLAALFEGGLVLIALAIGWFGEFDPLEHFFLDWNAAAWGLAGTVPLFALFLLSMRFPIWGLKRIKDFLIEVLGPPLAACRWYDLVLLAALVGFSEELLFRGLIQPRMEASWGPVHGLVWSNVLFGLAHCVTPAYGVLAGLTGAYLGWLLDAGGRRQLLAPVVTHAVYDLLAFVCVARAYRLRQCDRPLEPVPAPTPEPDIDDGDIP